MNRARLRRRFPRLPDDIGRWEDESAPAHGVILAGPSAGGPRELRGRLLEVLLDVERRGLHLILVARAPSDLVTPVAAVARHVLTDDPGTLRQARSNWGTSQVVPVHGTTEETILDAVARLPVPASRTVRRRLQARSRHLRALVDRIRSLRG